MKRITIAFKERVNLPKFDFSLGEIWVINPLNKKHRDLPNGQYSVGGGIIKPCQYDVIKTS